MFLTHDGQYFSNINTWRTFLCAIYLTVFKSMYCLLTIRSILALSSTLYLFVRINFLLSFVQHIKIDSWFFSFIHSVFYTEKSRLVICACPLCLRRFIDQSFIQVFLSIKVQNPNPMNDLWTICLANSRIWILNACHLTLPIKTFILITLGS